MRRQVTVDTLNQFMNGLAEAAQTRGNVHLTGSCAGSRGRPESVAARARHRRRTGHELVEQGLEDLRQNCETEAALHLLIAAPRLRRLGLAIPERAFPRPYEHRLYARLEDAVGAGAHSYNNSLLRRSISDARALEREQAWAPMRSVQTSP